jgi:hypothetical protein
MKDIPRTLLRQALAATASIQHHVWTCSLGVCGHNFSKRWAKSQLHFSLSALWHGLAYQPCRESRRGLSCCVMNRPLPICIRSIFLLNYLRLASPPKHLLLEANPSVESSGPILYGGQFSLRVVGRDVATKILSNVYPIWYGMWRFSRLGVAPLTLLGWATHEGTLKFRAPHPPKF